MKVRATFSDKGSSSTRALQSALGRMPRRVSVDVGLLSGGQGKASDLKTDRKPAPKTEGKGRPATPKKTLVDIATIHEFGLGVPQRSFLRAFSDERGAEVQQRYKQIELATVGQLKKGGLPNREQSYMRLGAWIVGQIRARIGSGIQPANAASTVRRKGSSKPLINTGQLRSGITFRVREGGGVNKGATAPRVGSRRTKRAGKSALKRARNGSVKKLRAVRKATTKFLKKSSRRK